MKKIILPFLILSILFLFLSFSRFFFGEVAPSIDLKTGINKINKPTFPIKKPEITGWFAYWDEQNASERLPEVIDMFNTFSPMLYRVMSDGSLGRHNVITRENIILLAREKGIPIAPVITDEGDSERIQELLYNDEVQKQFIDQLISEAEAENFIGWNFDIEKVKSSDRIAFSNFVRNLSVAFRKNQLKLIVVLYARGEEESYDPALAHDYKAIGRYADQVQLMTFEYNNSLTDPGGQAPLSWYRSVLEYATETIPREKILVGLTTHGYDWGGGAAEALTYPEVKKRIEENGATVTYNKRDSSKIATYQKDGEKHEIWFEDATTIIEKVQIAQKEFGINNFAFWRLNAEDPSLWEGL